MPKSGGWLASVKVVLGFVETALAFKFLSMADQAYHWNILPRDIYLVIWIVIATGLVLFMLNLIPFKGVDKFQKWGPVRLVFTLIAVLFDAYLISGLFGAPLQALSGYLPPQQEKGWFYDNSVAHEMDGYDVSTVKYGDKLKLSNGINGFFELKQAPVVDTNTAENVSLTYRDMILVLPTPLSPTKTTLHVFSFDIYIYINY
jgi:thiol:disulfide interchange protein DsbD